MFYYGAFGFGSFLFYKIATAMVIGQSMSLIAALLTAVLSVIALGFQTHTVLHGSIATRQWQAAAGKVLAGGCVMAGIGWLICQGFSPAFAEEISISEYYGFDRSYQFVMLGQFFVILAAPCWVGGAHVMWNVRAIYGSRI